MSVANHPLRKNKWTSEDMPDQSGKVFIITGANSGLGKEATFRLAKKNAEVVMACRNEEKGRQSMNEIKEKVPHAKLAVKKLDLSDLKSVDEFTDQFLQSYGRLDVLMNNAGIMQPPRMNSVQGYEIQFAVNHLGHFYLTYRLYDILKNTPRSRVVTQSSIAHTRGKINFENINSERSYSRTGAYAQSKLANLLFAYELARRAGNDVLSVAVHPGYTNTNLQQSGPSIGGTSFFARLYRITDKLAMPVWKGTLPMLYAMTESDVNPGDYIGPSKLGGARGWPRRIKSSKRSYNEEDARRLWEISEEMTGIKFLSER